MKILAVGGGSGGHVTPVVAVLSEIRKSHPKARLRFWCDFKFASHASGLIKDSDPNVKVTRIVAGKFRRYNHLSWLQQLMWFRLVLLNLRDLFLVVTGFAQSFVLLIFWRPDAIFLKGGYVCLPVGYAARILGIPIVIHDSDAHPGLTNRLLSKFATRIATGAPLEYYNYPISKSKYVGIPISKDFRKVSEAKQKSYKYEWGIDSDKPLIVVTGGGLGALRLNNAVAETLEVMSKDFNVVLVSGSAQYDELRTLMPRNNKHFQLHPFIAGGMASLLAAADIVVTRAGATTLLELAALAKPTIIIPNAKLVAGHQIKNAKVYADAKAAVVLDESKLETDPQLIYKEAKKLTSDKAQMKLISERFYGFAKLDAARDVANMVIEAAGREK